MKRRNLVRFASFVAGYMVLEALSFAALVYAQRCRGLTYRPRGSALDASARARLDQFLARGRGDVVDHDPILGWVSLRTGPESNSAGMRDDREYALRPAVGRLRISAFGDSFTFGSDVRLGENWAKQVSAIRPNIEVLNYGVGGYGLDQAYLRYLQVGSQYHPAIVLIGFMTENICRNVNVYRGYYTDSYPESILAKPRFRASGTSLTLLPNPLPHLGDLRRFREHEAEVLSELGRNDYYFVARYQAGPLDFSPTVRLLKMVLARWRGTHQIPVYTSDGRYNPHSEAYQVTLRIFDAFYQKVLDDGAVPIILVLPEPADQERSQAGQVRRYAQMVDYFQSKRYRYIDGLEAFEAVQRTHSIADLSVRWGHYSKLGNQLIAKLIVEKLAKWQLSPPGR